MPMLELPTRARSRVGAMAAVAVTALALVGCTAAPAPAPSTEPGEPIALTVGVSPSTLSVGLYLAAEKEFAEHGLDVTLEVVASGADAIPRLLNGELAFSVGDGVGTVTAVANGVPITATGVATLSPSEPEKDAAAIVAGSPDITEAADLNGKVIAVNQLKGFGELVTRAAIDDQGGDSSTVQFIELPFPQMIEAVKTGRVDAATVVEPFRTGALGAGLHVILAPHPYAVPDLPSAIVISSLQFAKANPDVVEAFNAALGEASARANADPELAQATAAATTELPAELLPRIIFQVYAEDSSSLPGLLDVVDLMNEYEFLQTQPDTDALVYSAGD
jgi:NitT/TauT family transport system substrate-binding protein